MSDELPQGFEKSVIGYCDPLSIFPGESIGFKLSSYAPGEAQVGIVHLVSGDDRPHGTGLIERSIASDMPKLVKVGYQPLVTGSYAHIVRMPGFARGKFEISTYPTLVDQHWQCIANLAGLCLFVSQQGFRVTQGDDVLDIEMPIAERRWYHLELDFSAGWQFTASQQPLGSAESSSQAHGDLAQAEGLAQGDWYFAAQAVGQSHFNGRLQQPMLSTQRGVIASWDFAQAAETNKIIDVGGQDHHGQLHQTPTRAVCGANWDGSAQDFRQCPEQYGAIHFHEDDLTDALWSDTLTWQVPDELPSGQYALKVTQGESEDYVPFFVRAPRGNRGSDLLYLVPSATYLAYANQRLGFAGGILGETKMRNANTAFLFAHEDVGYSLYEYHRDGSGVHFSSRLRPIMNMKPKNTTWAFAADTHITAWLDALNQPFDVLTDEDLHLEGAQALDGYRTVITGTHPEYYSTDMRDGLEQWLAAGGRLMYMGGNGFYWRVAYDPDNPAIIEVRRAEDGTRAWIAQPGEYYHQYTGEYGGLWRRLGRPPNQLVGVGFAAQGFDGGTYYRVQPGALDPRVDFIVDGMEDSELWGDFGNQGGGAAGEEIDRFDAQLGSPAHAVVLATSENHRPGMLRVKEEFHMTEPLGNDPKVKADMVFFEVPGGGAVFSTGSISYAGSLAHNDYHNNIAKLTGNVLKRFLESTPFEYPN